VEGGGGGCGVVGWCWRGVVGWHFLDGDVVMVECLNVMGWGRKPQWYAKLA
jgi:hypothetical protein